MLKDPAACPWPSCRPCLLRHLARHARRPPSLEGEKQRELVSRGVDDCLQSDEATGQLAQLSYHSVKPEDPVFLPRATCA